MKKVAIAPPHTSEQQRYMNWIESMGYDYKFLSESDDVLDFDLLFLCGGADVLSEKSKERTKNEMEWFKRAYSKIYVFGICRGMQLANMTLDGTLIDDLNTDILHRHYTNHEGKIYTSPTYHSVSTKNETFAVNSIHHQAIDKLSPELTVLGKSQDNTIEIAKGNKSLFVQWHPERPEIRNMRCEMYPRYWINTVLKH
jgi:gamma-glutamyl-gamma-aminobutyrate hydrolase PuuD